MIRLILGILFVVLFLIVSIPIQLVELLVKKISPAAAEMSQLRIVQWAFKVLIFLSGAKVTVLGAENLAGDSPVLYVGNHQSFFDIIISYSLMKNRTGYVSKKSIGKIPILNIYMKRLCCLYFDRSSQTEGFKMLTSAIAYMKEGISMFIYPEGTRNKSNDETNLAPFHDGSFLIAQRAKCPVVPVSFNNTVTLFEKHLPFLRPAHVVVEFGKPVSMDSLDREQKRHVGEYFRGIVLEMVKRNQKLV
jgi:1-acyl-sn-glycerol-3-phosphate acyltransferase